MTFFQRVAVLVLAVTAVAMGEDGPPTSRDAGFVHPGGLHTREDLDRMKAKVAAKQSPWIDGWNLLVADRRAQNTYKASPKPNMGVSRQRAQDDAAAAYLNALRWHVSGDVSYAECAVRNLNGWSAVVDRVPSGNDQPGLGGIPIGSFALAAELLRPYPGWAAADQERFKRMLLTHFYPVCHDFLTNHRGAHHTTYWANWDAANVLSLLAIGVYCDDRAVFDEGVAYYKNGIGMGSIKNAVPFLYPGGLGQWQESGRDHAHAFGGLGLLVETCQVAWNQNVDLFGYDNDRILAGAAYEAQYAQWIGVPYTYYTNNEQANQHSISTNYRGRLSNCEFYELLYNHYAVRRGRSVPEIERFARLLRPEGGNADLMGYGSLTYTLDAGKSPLQTNTPPAPLDVTAAPGVGRVALNWSPSGAYITQGYEVLRATTADGPFTAVFGTKGNTTPAFVDTKVESGRSYFYKILALNQAGRSAESVVVTATPAAAAALPEGWTAADIGTADKPGGGQFAAVGGGTFVVTGGGAGIGGSADNCQFTYTATDGDFTLTARLIDRAGKLNKVGLMVRQSRAADAPSAVFTLGEIGGRQARFSARSAPGAKSATRRGNDYTWLPVWFRLQRVGNAIIGSQSPDGATWFPIGTLDVPMPASCLAGLAVSSGVANETGTVTFDHVTLRVTPPAVPPAPNTLTAKAVAECIRLEWPKLGGEVDGVRVECSTDGTLFYEVTDLSPQATHLIHTGVTGKRHYRVRAYNGGGFSGYSTVAAATVGG